MSDHDWLLLKWARMFFSKQKNNHPLIPVACRCCYHWLPPCRNRIQDPILHLSDCHRELLVRWRHFWRCDVSWRDVEILSSAILPWLKLLKKITFTFLLCANIGECQAWGQFNIEKIFVVCLIFVDKYMLTLETEYTGIGIRWYLYKLLLLPRWKMGLI